MATLNAFNQNNVGASVLPSDLGMYTLLMDTILHYQNVMGMFTTHNIEQFYNVAKMGLDQITFDTYSVPQVCKFTIRSNKTAPLPIGYIDYIEMQIMDDRGEVVDIVRNRKISKLGARQNERPVELEYPDLTYDNDFYSTLFGYYYPENMPGALGFGGEFNKYGEFDIDNNTHQILFPSNFPYQNGVMVYLSNESNKNSDGEYVVHVFAQLFLMRWTDWMIKSFNTKKYSLGEIQLAEKYQNDERALMISRFGSFTEEEFFDTVTKQIKLAVKN